MIITTEYALGMKDLTDDQFRIVATKGPGDRLWFWTITDAKAFQAAVGHRDIVSVQRRDAFGIVLLAKLAAVR